MTKHTTRLDGGHRTFDDIAHSPATAVTWLPLSVDLTAMAIFGEHKARAEFAAGSYVPTGRNPFLHATASPSHCGRLVIGVKGEM
jgi:hypothetical protein